MDHWTRVRGTKYFIQNGDFFIQKEGEGGRPFIQYDVQRLFSFNLCLTHRLNMELDIQSLFGLLCTAVLIGWYPPTPPLPPHFGSYTRALLVSQERRHLLVTPGLTLLDSGHISKQSDVFCWRLPNILKNENNALIGWGITEPKKEREGSIGRVLLSVVYVVWLGNNSHQRGEHLFVSRSGYYLPLHQLEERGGRPLYVNFANSVLSQGVFNRTELFPESIE